MKVSTEVGNNPSASQIQQDPAPAFRRLLVAAAHQLSAALFPRRCFGCGMFLAGMQPNGGRRAMRKPSSEPVDMENILCVNCRGGVELTASPLCSMCGVMFESRMGADHLCGDCVQRPRHYRRARAAAVYNGVTVRLIHAFKYGGKTRLAEPLGELLQDAFRRFWSADGLDLAIPVPLHRRRFRQRGFNQSYLLMGGLRVSRDGLGGIPVERRALERVRSTPAQTGLGRIERRRNIRGAFRVRSNEAVYGRRILLIDDVYTTGATVEECSRALVRSGADRVEVLTLARAMPSRLDGTRR